MQLVAVKQKTYYTSAGFKNWGKQSLSGDHELSFRTVFQSGRGETWFRNQPRKTSVLYEMLSVSSPTRCSLSIPNLRFHHRHVASARISVGLSVKPRKDFICNCAMNIQGYSIPVLVNGCAGKMGTAVAEAVLAAGLHLVPLSFTSPVQEQQKLKIKDVDVDVLNTTDRESILNSVKRDYPDIVVVDFTVPAAVNENAELYCKVGVPFVMGTTGGDREKLYDTVKTSSNYAVIAPQMGKQVVAFQAAMEIMADQFPGAFSGYRLQVTESHQSGKLDTSGTAKAIVSCFQKLGVNFNFDQIEMVRDAPQQVQRVGVPEDYLEGHAFHTYTLTAPDSTVVFQFQHNVCGRSIYAQGTVDAVIFLANKVKSKAEKKLYNMIDVLREGNMR